MSTNTEVRLVDYAVRTLTFVGLKSSYHSLSDEVVPVYRDIDANWTPSDRYTSMK